MHSLRGVAPHFRFREDSSKGALDARTIEVQDHQKVIDTGLYGIVRHPRGHPRGEIGPSNMDPRQKEGRICRCNIHFPCHFSTTKRQRETGAILSREINCLLTLPHPQTPSLGEGAGGRSRLAGQQALSAYRPPKTIHEPPLSGPSLRMRPSAFNLARCFSMALGVIPMTSASFRAG